MCEWNDLAKSSIQWCLKGFAGV